MMFPICIKPSIIDSHQRLLFNWKWEVHEDHVTTIICYSCYLVYISGGIFFFYTVLSLLRHLPPVTITSYFNNHDSYSHDSYLHDSYPLRELPPATVTPCDSYPLRQLPPATVTPCDIYPLRQLPPAAVTPCGSYLRHLPADAFTI